MIPPERETRSAQVIHGAVFINSCIESVVKLCTSAANLPAGAFLPRVTGDARASCEEKTWDRCLHTHQVEPEVPRNTFYDKYDVGGPLVHPSMSNVHEEGACFLQR